MKLFEGLRVTVFDIFKQLPKTEQHSCWWVDMLVSHFCKSSIVCGMLTFRETADAKCLH